MPRPFSECNPRPAPAPLVAPGGLVPAPNGLAPLEPMIPSHPETGDLILPRLLTKRSPVGKAQLPCVGRTLYSRTTGRSREARRGKKRQPVMHVTGAYP